nr:variable surface lipoprotein [Mycoplasmopsis agalactiae]
MSSKFKMKKSSKFLSALGSISVLTTLPLIAAKCNEPEAKIDKDGNKTDTPATTTTTETTDVNSIVKDLKDVLTLSSDSKKDDILKKLKEDSSKYTLWYDRKDHNIVITEGTKAPFGKSFSGKKWVLFTLNDKASKITGNFQLVNDTKPTYSENKLSTQLNFSIDEKKENITIKYKVGEFKGKDTAPEISEKANESTVSIK